MTHRRDLLHGSAGLGKNYRIKKLVCGSFCCRYGIIQRWVKLCGWLLTVATFLVALLFHRDRGSRGFGFLCTYVDFDGMGQLQIIIS